MTSKFLLRLGIVFLLTQLGVALFAFTLFRHEPLRGAAIGLVLIVASALLLAWRDETRSRFAQQVVRVARENIFLRLEIFGQMGLLLGSTWLAVLMECPPARRVVPGILYAAVLTFCVGLWLALSFTSTSRRGP